MTDLDLLPACVWRCRLATRRATLVTLVALGTMISSLGIAGRAPAQTPATAHDRVWGRVLDATLHPVAGAGIAVTRRGEKTTTVDAAAHPLTRTDAHGRFGVPGDAFSAPELVGGDAILIASPGLTSLRIPVSPQSADLGDLVLGRAAVLRGRVRGADGEPLPRVRVEATEGGPDGRTEPSREIARAFASTTTGDDGVFELPGALAQGARLVVRRPGWGSRILDPVWPGSPLDVTLGRTAVLRGRLLDVDGEGLSGAVLHVLYEDRRPPSFARTGAGGHFEVELGQRTRRRVEAFARFGTGTLRAGTDWLGHADTTTTLRFSSGDRPLDQPAAAGVDAVVKDHHGAAVAHFEAAALWVEADEVERGGDGALLQDWDRCVRTGRGGRVRLGGPHPSEARTGTVVVRAPGYAEGRVDDVRAGGRAVQLTLLPEATLAGIVVDATSGEPIAEATVWAEAPAPIGAPPRNVAPPHRSARTDRTGRFELVGLAAGRHAVHARRNGRAEPVVNEVTLGAAEHRDGLRLTLPAVPTVRGRVTGVPAGTALRVQLRGVLGDVSAGFPRVPIASTTVELGPDGRFAVPAPRAGNYGVELIWPRPPQGGPPLRVEVGRVDLDGGPGSFEVDAGGRLPGVVRGRVRCAKGGMPLERLQVVAEPPPRGEPATAFFELVGARAPVGVGGAFEVVAPPGAARLVLLDAESRVAFAWTPELTVPSAAVVERELAFEAARLRLMPIADGGGPTAACRIEVRPPDRLYPVGVGRLAPRIGLHSGQGVDLPAGAGPRTVWVPLADSIQLRLHTAGDRAHGALPTRPFTSLEVTPDASHEIEVELRIPGR